ncbi:NUDIX hydrolase [Planococcus sp. X10-3]|uniref:NUDIX hydrolase n=1 Tax=Planococcus sp. X10-3 TaxID=3061240 RepID=UPI003BB059F7
MTVSYVKWGEATVKLSWERSEALPDQRLITSVHGFCFYGNQLLLVDLKQRGWDFPGGHIEEGETPEACFQREAMEEGYVSGSCELLGFIVVDHTENQFWEEQGKYPKIGYQVFYRMDIEKLHPFEAEHESARRILVPIREVSDNYHDWSDLYQDILFAAVDLK